MPAAGVVLLEYFILALSNLRWAIWALPASALKLALVTGLLWIMTPCNNFDKSDVVLNWVILGLSLITMVYSYVMWIRYQRFAMYSKRPPLQV